MKSLSFALSVLVVATSVGCRPEPSEPEASDESVRFEQLQVQAAPHDPASIPADASKADVAALLNRERSRLDQALDDLIAFRRDSSTGEHAAEAELLQILAARSLMSISPEGSPKALAAVEEFRDREDLTAGRAYHIGVIDLTRLLVIPNESTQRSANLPEAEKTLARFASRYPNTPEVDALANRIGAAREQLVIGGRRAFYEELAASETPALQSSGQALLRKLDLIGSSVSLRFTALDGREVDLDAMKGRVVLVDFWAMWCAPCLVALPELKALYADNHARGFEIVGVNLDTDRSTLERFIQTNDIAWPQYFDGQGWQNEVARRWAIHGIPAQWLIDRSGKVAAIEVGASLRAQIEELLERPSEPQVPIAP